MGLSLQSTEWKRLRLEILQRDQHTCYMCGDVGTEIDHIFPRSKGGSDEPENLAAACRRCNNAKSGKVAKPVFLTPSATPPDLISVKISNFKPADDQIDIDSNYNEPDQTDIEKPQSKSVGGTVVGSPTPRIFSSPVIGATSRAPEVVAFAESIGINLMPWQINALQDMLLIKDGRFVRKLIHLSLPRQQGKTELCKVMILAHIYLFGTKSIGMMSANREGCAQTFREIHWIIQANPILMGKWDKTYLSNGMQRMQFKDGGSIVVLAATDAAPRGRSIELFFVDELLNVDEAAWAAANFTTIAKPNAVVLTASSAGHKGSAVLNQMRDKAIADKTPSLGWLEWSALPSRKLSDRKGYIEAQPALGHTVSLETIEHQIATQDESKSRSELLNQFIGNIASPWPTGAWESCKVENMVFEPGASTFFAIDISPSRRHAALVAGQLNGEKVKLKCLQTWKSEASIDDLKVASEINLHIQRFRPKMLLFDRYTTAGIAARLAHTGVPVTEISGQLFASACDEMLAAMSHNRIEHGDEYELSESVNSCAMRTTDSGWRIVRRKSAGEVANAICAAMLIWYANKPQAVAAIYVN